MNGRAEHTSNVVFSYRTGYVQRMHSVPQLITAFPPNRFARRLQNTELSTQRTKKNTKSMTKKHQITHPA